MTHPAHRRRPCPTMERPEKCCAGTQCTRTAPICTLSPQSSSTTSPPTSRTRSPIRRPATKRVPRVASGGCRGSGVGGRGGRRAGRGGEGGPGDVGARRGAGAGRGREDVAGGRGAGGGREAAPGDQEGGEDRDRAHRISIVPIGGGEAIGALPERARVSDRGTSWHGAATGVRMSRGRVRRR